MKKLYVSGNYVIAIDGNGYTREFAINHCVYYERNDKFTISENGEDQQRIEIDFTDAVNWTNDLAVAYDEATMRTFLRENTGFNTASGGSEATVSVNVGAFSTLRIPEVTKDNYIFGNVEFFVYSKIAPTQILVPVQPSTGEPVIGNLEANINNNILTDICYNNFGAASGYDLPFYTFDYGSPVTVDRFRIWWWQFNNYVPNVFRIEANNSWNPVPDGSWTTIEGGLTGTNISGNIQDVLINDNTPYRYWRMYIETPFPASVFFIVCREMEGQSAGNVYESIENSSDVNFYFDADGILNVENLIGTDTQLTVRYKA